MTMTLSQADIWELYETTDFVETELAADFYEVKGKAPQLLGDGHFWEIDLCEGIWLGISTWTNPNVCTIACEERQHEVEITLWIPTRRQNSHYTFFGSGIAPKEVWKSPADREGIFLSIGFEPDLLKRMYSNSSGELPPELQMLITSNDWQQCWRDRPLAPVMHAIVRQIQACPYQGLTKQIYLQGKVLELLALGIEPLRLERAVVRDRPLNRNTVERVYQARDILQQNCANPPSVVDLAQQVGLEHMKLKRGFRACFGTTPFAYLRTYRLEQARLLLQEGKLSIAAIANEVGYSHLGHFARAFQDKFGITPTECRLGKQIIL
ncbi:helix-turn-helix transcriptional regulator [Chroococcidiopsis thermalis]|uniref:Transcriptional regulator, AraC family n=1 Tax=Chroococcidiopsis thermalis (strain PCC 7203) TaxID=251229 RepID=K9TZX4_CHRTP|nr:AraC family transcriptional regulator [Chroococcidiopsis thermalis]AFY87933.1 transcriptional regulator, AraC family [Chroococcidiopsis thermalis PCC 7203]PSB47042.1 AraC family transcriptional regulator [Cyanosarcina cf. burmensis CCALA 770]